MSAEPAPVPVAQAEPARRFPPPRRLALLAGLYLLALLPRLWYGWQLADSPFFAHPIGNAAGFLQMAERLLSQGALIDGVFFYAPLYPTFLAGALAVSGHNFAFVHGLQFLIGAGSCLLVFLIAERWAGSRAAAVAYGAAVCYRPFWFFEGELVGVFLSVWFLLLALFLAWRREERTWWRPLLAGLAAAAVVCDRSNFLLCLPVFPLWYAVRKERRREGWVQAGAFLLGVCLVLGPVALRNRVVGEDWVLITSQGGINFYIGNNPQAQGIYAVPAGMGVTTDEAGLYQAQQHRAAELATGRELTPSQVSRWWWGQAREFLRDQPGAAAVLYWRKGLLLCHWFEFPLQVGIPFSARFTPILNGPWLGYGLLFPLGIFGLALVRPRLRDWWLPVAGCVVYAGSVLLFFVNDRYRLPLAVFLILFAAAGVDQALRLIRERRWPPLLLAGFVALPFLLLSRWPIPLPPAATPYEWAKAGEAYLAAARWDDALAMFGEARALAPNDIEAWRRMGEAHARKGQPAQGWPHYRAYLEALREMGRTGELERALAEARRLFPGQSEQFPPGRRAG